ncbi:hypothetical protein NDU88_006288 [Pleurodeles waltl]|uniref:Uncharacterized protein n=1 Tax=Pleurodeles waltl TaxID=8319 RepID=A0AAV7N3L9_PLEWA|nr:hypothetical protein NDU88_006288 [Pleurodeles waltl]
MILTPAVDGAAGAAGSSPGPAKSQLDFGTILKAIQASREAVEHKDDELPIDLSLIQQDLRGVTGRVKEAEKCISTMEDELAVLKRQFSKLTFLMAELYERVEDAETLDAPDLAVALERWLPAEKLSSTFIIKHVHHSLAPQPPVGTPPDQSS